MFSGVGCPRAKQQQGWDINTSDHQHTTTSSGTSVNVRRIGILVDVRTEELKQWNLGRNPLRRLRKIGNRENIGRRPKEFGEPRYTHRRSERAKKNAEISGGVRIKFGKWESRWTFRRGCGPAFIYLYRYVTHACALHTKRQYLRTPTASASE